MRPKLHDEYTRHQRLKGYVNEVEKVIKLKAEINALPVFDRHVTALEQH